MQTLWQDFRYTLRQLRNAPGFALTAVLTLALGLGATTAMLAIVDSVLLRPVALPHAERIVNIGHVEKGRRQDWLRYTDFQALRDGTKSFTALAAYQSLPTPVVVPAGPRVLPVFSVTPQFFAVSGAPAQLGRLLGPNDKDAPVAVVSDAFWRDVLGSDPHVLGSSIKVQSTLLRVVGVLPPGYAFPQPIQSPAVYRPLIVNAKGENEHGFSSVPVVARLRPDASLASALLEAKAVYTHLPPAADEDRGQLAISPYRDTVTGDIQPALLALFGACALLMLIACVNSANLQIARGVNRAGEIHIRAALGAGRARLLRQLMTESITISLLGAACALPLAYIAIRWARTAYEHNFARFDELALHPAVFAGCALLAVATGVLAALAPASSALRRIGGLPLAQNTRVTGRSRLSGGLVALEVALTCVLLFSAGLFIRTFRSLEHVPLGFDPQHVTEMVLMPLNPREDGAALKQTYDRLLERFNSLPGVQAATTETTLPFSNFSISMTSDFSLSGRTRQNTDTVFFSLVDAGYSKALGNQVREGRGFMPSDVAGSQPVCLVNEAFVRKYGGRNSILGRILEFKNDRKDGKDPRLMREPLTIVGVLQDVTGGLGEQPDPTLFASYKQFHDDQQQARFLLGIAPQFAVRSTLPQASLEREIRAALKEAAPDMAEMQLESLEQSIIASFTIRRLALRLATGFGLLALTLAAVGIYGVLAYSVAQRTREIGIRMALGATRGKAMGLVLRQAGVMVAAGLAVGLLGAWPAGRAVKAFLYGVTPLDPLTLFAAAAVLLLVSACAAAVPAYRATQVDPMEALRTE